jgi:hypothetical protein
MYVSLAVIFLGLFIIYLLVDFVFVCGGDINTYGTKWLKKFLWLWLPFYGIWRLLRDMFFCAKTKK